MTIRITYNTNKTIDLLVGPNGLDTIYKTEYKRQQSGNGKAETINLYGIEKLAFDARFKESTYRDLIAWWSWARQGKSWAFAKDSGNAEDTTTILPLIVADTELPVASTSGFSADDVCLMREADGTDYEIVVIDSIVSGKLVVTSGIKFAYATAAIVRHWDYWPDVISTDTQFNPTKNGDYYSWTFNFMENL